MKTNKEFFFHFWIGTLIVLQLLLASTSFIFASDPIPAAKQKKPIALVGGTIHTISGADIVNGSVVFDKGKIIAIGESVLMPADAEKVSVIGKHIYPGLICAKSTIGLTEVDAVRATNDYSEIGTINPNVRVETAINPESEHIPVARSGGVLIAVSAPSGGIISGLAAALMLDGWTSEDMLLKPQIGLIINWPQMVYVPSRWERQSKEDWLKQRDASLKTLHDAFIAARAYKTAKEAEQKKGIPYHKTDSRWEAMIPVLESKVPLWIAANDVSQIQSAIMFAEEEKCRIIITSGRDSWRIADQLKAKNIPVILNGILDEPSRPWEDYDLIYSLPHKLKEAGVDFCIGGDVTSWLIRNLNHHAATAAAFGLSKEDALRSITLDAARIIGIADRCGSIEAGKDATLIVTDGDILELSSSVEMAFIQGKKLDLRDKHKQLYSKYQEKYKQ